MIIKNRASANATNHDIAADNPYGPIIDITATASAAVNGSNAASTLTSTDPWANYSYQASPQVIRARPPGISKRS